MAAASVLTLAEQRKAMSVRKKKKLKNILRLPSSFKVEPYVTTVGETERITKILEGLLPSAKIPVRIMQDSKNEKHPNDPDLINKTKLKRKQLALGVNDLNRSIKKKNISAVLLANDIQPKFLVHHLNLLCNHNQVPYLHIPGLRKVIQNCLGFPCIALGFRLNCDGFIEVIKEIQSIFEIKKILTDDKTECSESDEDESLENGDKNFNEEEPVFDYLRRTSTRERIFDPEKINGNHLEVKETESDFISVAEVEDIQDSVEANIDKTSKTDIKGSIVKKKKHKLSNFDVAEDSDDELYKVPKAKKKKVRTIDKVGNKKKFRYFPVNVTKPNINPKRLKNNHL